MNRKIYIKKIKTKTYFKSHIMLGLNHWVKDRKEAKIFKSVIEAVDFIYKYKIDPCSVDLEFD